ncbi:MAG: hypothetical protein JWQ91_1505 [Aeromicrobium sp.]|jgi:hypothetical protein|uniref:immunoglobulin domain-containing protein n=1 Tax=Aeromicrobium sp. TaxID=1871063 RepID=UPI00261588E5|nr:immunoglobulin domain-containing protein [Aeromicrobium sp.]MCW2824588.1 hypothetical protein [Aeromicrobium sp.]MCW2839150.1 hypothetical protein [Aeromicrobium sp.]
MQAVVRRSMLSLLVLLATVSLMLGMAVSAEAASSPRPVIKVQPKSVTAAPGTKVTFSVKASKAKKYQWQKRVKGKGAWRSIAGSRRAKLSLTARMSLHGTSYRVKVRNGKKSRFSRSVRLSVVDPSGSRTNPVPVRTPFASGAWTFVLDPTDTDAWPEIRSANMFNDPPLPGYSYVMVAATVTYRGAETGTPWLNTSAEFLGSNGIVYNKLSGDQWCGVVPQSMSDVNDMYPGASVRGNYCAVVPTSAIAGGLWRVKGDNDDYSASPEVFVRTY